MMNNTNIFLLITLVFSSIACTKNETSVKTTASFQASTASASAGTSISFTNNSVNANYSLWDFGDGSVTIADNPTHTFASEGTYVVKLVAVGDDNTAEDSLTITIADVTVIDGEGIKEFSLGASWTDILALYPNADTARYIEFDSDYLVYYQEIYFINQGIDVVLYTADSTISSSDVVTNIWVLSPYDATTSKGIKLGDSMSGAASTYGTPSQTYDGSSYYAYVYTTNGVLFYSSNSDEVDAIQVFYPSSSTKSVENRKNHPMISLKQ